MAIDYRKLKLDFGDTVSRTSTLPSLSESAIKGISIGDIARELPGEIAKATKWLAVLPFPGIRDRFIEEKPEEAMRYISEYENLVVPIIRKAYPSSIPLAVAEKVAGKKLTATFREVKERAPISTTIGGLVGDIYNLISLSVLTGGISNYVKVPSWGRATFPYLTQFVPRAAHFGTTWGLKGVLDESISQFQKGEFIPTKIASEGGKNALFGTLLAGAWSIETTGLRVLASGAARGVYTTLETYLREGKIRSEDLPNIGANTILGLVFGAINAKGVTARMKQRRFDVLLNRQAVVRTGLPEKEAEKIVGAINKLGSLQKMPPAIIQQIKNQTPKELQFLSQVEQVKIADQIIKSATPAIQSGQPVWDSVLKALQSVGFPRIEIPLKPVGQPMLPKMPEVTTAVPVGKAKAIPLKGAKKLKLELKVPATTEQIKQAHALAKQKALITAEGKTTPQYRRLAEGLTGKKTMTEMTQEEASNFIKGLLKIKPRLIKGEQLPPIIPTTKELAVEGFFEKEFNKPTFATHFTPSDRYARTLGVYDLIEPSIKAKTKMLLERREIFKWLDKQEKAIYRIERAGKIETAKAFIKGRPTITEAKWFDLLDKNKTATEAGLTGESAKIFSELRNLTNRMLERTNIVREQVGLEPIEGLKSYITHLKDIATKKALKEKYPFPEEIKYWLNFVKPKHIYNPTAFHRIIQDEKGLLRNPFKALKAMVSMDLKQVYLEKPNILFREQIKALKDIIPASTRQWVELYMNEVIKGYPTKLDQMTNDTLNTLGITKAIDLVLRPFGRQLGFNPVKEISGALSRVIHDAVIWARLKLVIRNHTQKLLTLGLYDIKAFSKALLPASKELNALIKSNDFWKISMGEFLERMPKDAFGRLETLGFIPYGKSHISNVGFAMKTAYYGAKELATNPKYAKYGWTNEDIIKEMEFGANTTQYWYNLMGMPDIYRSGIFRTFGVLQTWWMNYTMKYWREMLSRAFTGKTGWGKSIPVKWRLGALRHIITSLLFIEGIRRALGWNYKRIALFGVLPSYLSPPGQIVLGIYNYLTADTDWAKAKAKNQVKYAWNAFIPGSMAWKDFWKAWETGNIEELLFYTEERKGIPSAVIPSGIAPKLPSLKMDNILKTKLPSLKL